MGRRSLLECSVWPVLVVVRDVVADEAFELAVVPDDGSVEELAADRSDPSFGERIGDPGGFLRVLGGGGKIERECLFDL